MCLKEAECIDHVFIHCPFVHEVWSMFLKEIGFSWVFPKHFGSLISSWDMRNVLRKGRILWNLVLPAVCRRIWLERNQHVFEGYCEPTFKVFSRAKDLVCFWGLNCSHMEDYLATRTKEEWGRLFSCN